MLTILNVEKRDAGIYECQVNTVPIKSYHVKLEVLGKETIFYSLYVSLMSWPSSRLFANSDDTH